MLGAETYRNWIREGVDQDKAFQSMLQHIPVLVTPAYPDLTSFLHRVDLQRVYRLATWATRTPAPAYFAEAVARFRVERPIDFLVYEFMVRESVPCWNLQSCCTGAAAKFPNPVIMRP